MGLGATGHLVYAIDFGFATKFQDPTTHTHIPYQANKNFIGTVRYASTNTHLGIQQSRRDDLEALGYIFIYFFKGNLPWQHLKAMNKVQKYEKICEMKLSISTEELCSEMPAEFLIFINYCRGLRFEEMPNYSYIRHLFRTLFRRHGFSYDYVYDWHTENIKIEVSPFVTWHSGKYWPQNFIF